MQKALLDCGANILSQGERLGTREQNEKKFGDWAELPGGGRLYQLEIAGRFGWHACYFKEVDSKEVTVRFWQEIYDGKGALVEIHEKYPVDKGHQKL